jgi:hypothetical protein
MPSGSPVFISLIPNKLYLDVNVGIFATIQPSAKRYKPISKQSILRMGKRLQNFITADVFPILFIGKLLCSRNSL